MKQPGKILIAVFIALACMGQTQPQPSAMHEVVNDTLLQKTDSLLNVVRDLKQIVPQVEHQQKQTIVKINTFNYWLNKFLANFRNQKQPNDVMKDVVNNNPSPVIINREPLPVYGFTPAREQTDREKNDGKAFRGISNFFRKLFKRNEN